MTDYMYTILPGGNEGEFPDIDAELVHRQIVAHYRSNGTRVYRIADSEMHKLPTDEKGSYLGDDQSGHSMYRLIDADKYCDDINLGPWTAVV